MTIEINVDEDVNELIRQRIESGAFRDASDLVSYALRNFDNIGQPRPNQPKKSFYRLIRESPLMGSSVEFEQIGASEPPASTRVDDRTGADLIAAIQASPYREIELEQPRSYFAPVREVDL